MTTPTGPTQAEIDAAAEHCDRVLNVFGRQPDIASCEILARAYLAQRAAESAQAECDARPITPASLWAAGAKEGENHTDFEKEFAFWKDGDHDCSDGCILYVRRTASNVPYFARISDDDSVGVMLDKPLRTMGQLRAICSALGCPLPESEGEA